MSIFEEIAGYDWPTDPPPAIHTPVMIDENTIAEIVRKPTVRRVFNFLYKTHEDFMEDVFGGVL